jgi:hypothetical protein
VSWQGLQGEEDRVASAEPGEPRGRLTAAGADGELVGVEDHQLLQAALLPTDPTLAVDRVLKGAAGEH